MRNPPNSSSHASFITTPVQGLKTGERSPDFDYSSSFCGLPRHTILPRYDICSQFRPQGNFQMVGEAVERGWIDSLRCNPKL
ncbi:hypothetical protein VKT23_008210 [Stygiomarasmius scandens]|uniref:Uncharacterized protein n=1 Tax=Marasmiellus scandens TaxID=2682957 RepID=A0ABR1JHK1_9AGAR